ncbi:MAG: hypothetical protein Q4B17_14730 [Lautropia sp.]|nr:hypothetical protein [Lautropia sp.]
MSIPPPAKACLSLSLALTLSACGSSETDTGDGAPLQTKAISKTLLPPISSTGIRGDVLAQALRTQTSQRITGERRLMDHAVRWTAEYPGGQRDTTHTSPDFFIDQIISRNPAGSGLDGAFLYTHDPFPRTVGGAKNGSHAALTLRFGLSAQGLLDSSLSQAPMDTEVLQLGSRLEVSLFPEAATLAERKALQQQTLDARRSPAIRLNQEVEWRRPVYRWGSWGDPGDSTFVELFVREGKAPDQFHLCLRTSKLWQITQQHACSLWEVPAGWKPGQSLKNLGQTISLLRQGEPWQYWHVQAGTPKVDPDARQITSTHTSEDGISGALLAAMFDVWSPRGQGMQSFRKLSARYVYGRFGPLPDTFGPISKVAYQSSRVTQYADGATTGAYSPAMGTYLYALRSGQIPNDHAALPAIAVFAYPQTTLALNLRHENRDGRNVLTLPAWLGLDVLRQIPGTGERRWTYREELLDAPATSIAADELIRYQSVIKRWHTPGRWDGIVTLRLVRDDLGSASPILCWEMRLDEERAHIDRDVCTRWEVPANWQPGQKLTPALYNITDRAWLSYTDGTTGWHDTYNWANR